MLPTIMSILGIDYGDRKVGLACAADDARVAVPLTVVENRGTKALLAQLQAVCASEGVNKVVVGVPMSLSGAGEGGLRPADYANEQMQKVLDFVERLRSTLNVEVVTQDERLSTQEAIRLSADKRQGRPEDAVAAMIILQAYLDREAGSMK